MKIYGYKQYARPSWATRPPMTVEYASEVGTQAEWDSNGYVDKFYVGSVTLTQGNYAAKGRLVAQNADRSATLISIPNDGLDEGRVYCLLGVRFNGSGQVVAVSNVEFIHTLLKHCLTFPKRGEIIYDFGASGFLDAFRPDVQVVEMISEQRTDAVMGNHIRMSFPANYPIEPYDYALVSAFAHALKVVSPRHDWEVEFNLRWTGGHSSGPSFGEGTFGISSGSQNQIAMQHECHGGQGQEQAFADYDNLWPPAYDQPGTGMSYSQIDKDGGGAVLLSSYSHTYPDHFESHGDSATQPNPQLDWQLRPHAGSFLNPPNPAYPDSPYYAPSRWLRDTKMRVKYVYTAADYCVRVYFWNSTSTDWVLVWTFGPEQRLVTTRKKLPRGNNHLQCAVAPFIDWVYPQKYDILDIGEFRVKSSCPYHYGTYTVDLLSEGSGSSLFGDHGFAYLDFNACDFSAFRYYYNLGPGVVFLGRMTADKWRGLTIKPTNCAPGQTDWVWATNGFWWAAPVNPGTPLYPVASEVNPTDHANHTPYNQANNPDGWHFGKTPFVDLPDGYWPIKFDFQGIKRSGYIFGRIVNQNDEPVSDWVEITTVDGNQEFTIAPSPALFEATKVRAEIKMIATGQPNDPDHTVPVMFVGFGVYSQEGSAAVKEGELLTFTAWEGAQVYYQFNADTPGSFVAYDPQNPPTFGENEQGVYYYATDGTYTEPTPKFLSLAGMILKDPSGNVVTTTDLYGNPVTSAPLVGN